MVKRMDLCASRYAACVDAVGASIVCIILAHLLVRASLTAPPSACWWQKSIPQFTVRTVLMKDVKNCC